MAQTAREQIMKKLKDSPKQPMPEHPCLPLIDGICRNKEQIIENFSEEVNRQSGKVYRIKNYDRPG